MFRTRFNVQDFPREDISFELPSLTQQHFKDECDINVIIDRVSSTGVVDPNLIRQGVYADVSNIPDYQSALAIVNDANERFMSLPATIRQRFDNDPNNMLQFLADGNNKAEAIQLGLLSPEVSPVSTVTSVEE